MKAEAQRPEMENNPNFLKAQALKTLAIAKAQEKKKIAAGWRYVPSGLKARTLSKPRGQRATKQALNS